jgi:uncharacterized membrane protein YczE
MNTFYNKTQVKKYGKLLFGIFLCGLGIVMEVNSNLGAAPWDIFHIGLSRVIGIQYGKVGILVGAIVILLNIVLGQTIGVGTLLNMCFVGLFTDIIHNSGWIPSPRENLLGQLSLLIGGMFVFGHGTFLYMVQGKGAGPRDGLMQILNKKTNISIAIIKNGIEVVVLISGVLLGGRAGIGTLVYAVSIGFIIQWMFKLHRIEIKTLVHENLKKELSTLLRRTKTKKEAP